MSTRDVYIVDAVRTPIGRYNGALAPVRPDDLAAHVIRELLARTPGLDHSRIEDVYFGNANGAGEENRNVARMAGLLAGLPTSVPGVTVNRLCASGLEAVIQAARAIACGDAHIVLAGGVESMTRAPYVLPKSDQAFPAGHTELYSTTLAGAWSTRGWSRSGPSRSASRPNSSPTSTRSAASSRTSSPCAPTRRRPRRRPRDCSTPSSLLCRYHSARAIRCSTRPTSVSAPTPPSRRWPGSNRPSVSGTGP